MGGFRMSIDCIVSGRDEFVLHDAPLRFVSQCHLIGTKTFMLMIIDENYIEFLISI